MRYLTPLHISNGRLPKFCDLIESHSLPRRLVTLSALALALASANVAYVQ